LFKEFELLLLICENGVVLFYVLLGYQHFALDIHGEGLSGLDLDFDPVEDLEQAGGTRLSATTLSPVEGLLGLTNLFYYQVESLDVLVVLRSDAAQLVLLLLEHLA
jgi:hypothetical protein